MALRIAFKDGWYHVMARAPSKSRLFNDERDRKHFLELLGGMAERYGVLIHAYVLMDNHYHLLAQTPGANLSRAVQWLNVSYSKWINARTRDVGHVFSGRFKSVSVDGEGAWAEELSDYIHLNPLRIKALDLSKQEKKAEGSGLKAPTRQMIEQRLEKLRTYRWSSYRAYAGYESGPEWLTRDELLRRAGGSEKYRESVEDYVRQGEEESLSARLGNAAALGGEAFLAFLKKRVKATREQPARREFRDRAQWHDVLGAVKSVMGGEWKDYAGLYGDDRRDLALYLARRVCGMTLRELGEKAGIDQYKTVGKAVERFARRVKRERPLAMTIKRALLIMSKVEK